MVCPIELRANRECANIIRGARYERVDACEISYPCVRLGIDNFLLITVDERAKLQGVMPSRIEEVIAPGEDILLLQTGRSSGRPYGPGERSRYADVAHRQAGHQRELGTIHPWNISQSPNQIGAAI